MLKPVIKYWQLNEEEFGRVLRISEIADKLNGKDFLQAFQYKRIASVVAHAETLEEEGPAFKLLELLEEGSVTRDQISEYTGIDKSTIRAWLNGNSKPSRASTFKLAAFMESVDSDDKDEFKYELSRLVQVDDNTGITVSHICACLGVTKVTLLRWVTDPCYIPTEGNVKDFLPWIRKFNKARADLSKIMGAPPSSIGRRKVGRRAKP